MTNLDETIYWTARPSHWSMFFQYGVAAILIGGGAIINPLMVHWSSQAGLAGVQPGLWLCAMGAVYALWQFLAVRSVCYTITEERLLDESGVRNRITDTLELYRVKDTQVSQPIWLRPFGLGDIRVESSDRTTPTVILHAVSKPKAAATIIRNRVEEMRVRKGVRELD